MWLTAVKDLEKEENRFLSLSLEESFSAKKGCLLKRHPYFWKGRLLMWRSVSSKLTQEHVEYLKHGLHFDIKAVLLEQ